MHERDEPSPIKSSPDCWLTLDEASLLSKFSIITLRRALRRKALRGYRLQGGRQWRVRREDLETWLRGAVA